MHRLAPAKPAAGQPCNGCGWCCAWQPCPLGMLLSRRRHGRCDALHWDAAAAHYRCAALVQPHKTLRWVPERAARALVRRWIAAGQGCDASIEAG